MFIRFSDQEDINVIHHRNNTAGDFRLQDGTKIVGADKSKRNNSSVYR